MKSLDSRLSAYFRELTSHVRCSLSPVQWELPSRRATGVMPESAHAELELPEAGAFLLSLRGSRLDFQGEDSGLRFQGSGDPSSAGWLKLFGMTARVSMMCVGI